VKTAVIAWTHYNRRSALLAQHLNASMHHVYYNQRTQYWQTPLRYLIQALRTWNILIHERPDVVVVQNPPIFCVLVAFWYSHRYHAHYVIDSHTAAFLSPKWRWSLWLHSWLSRRAITTIITNEYLEHLVQSWGGHAFILGFTPAEYPEGTPYPLNGHFNVAVVSTGAEDEPVDVIFQAAQSLPETRFYVTGDAKRLAPDLLAAKPENCLLTGYIPYEQYVGLLRGVDAVIDLTTRDHTLLLGAFEAVSLGTPLIVSDWPILRDYFSEGTVHVPNTADGVYEGVRRAQRDRDVLRREIVRLREHLQAEWDQKFGQLQQLLGQARAA